MDAASLRIKFTPLLKKISNANKSKCFIEIVPELSRVRNLDKINWKHDNNLVEYSIPMMYKIVIKKQEDREKEFQNKTYHSCVDLLPAYSLPNNNLASGDVKRVTSDHYFLMNSISSFQEKYDIFSMKELLTKKGKIETTKAASIQTLGETCDGYNNMLSERKLADKCLEVNIKELESFTAIRATKSDESLKRKRKDNTTTTIDYTHCEKSNLVRSESIESLDVCLEAFNKKVPQHKLTLSPICSVNTCDIMPSGPMYVGAEKSRATDHNVSLKNMFNIGTMKYESSSKNDQDERDSNKKSNRRESRHFLRIYETKASLTIETIDNMSNTDNFYTQSNCKHVYNKPVTLNDITTSMSKRKNTETDKFIETNSHRYNELFKHHNDYTMRNVYETIESNNIPHVNDINHDPQRIMCVTESYKNPYKNDTRQTSNLTFNRIAPAVKVAQLMTVVENEIKPLKQMLHDIKYRCMVLGLGLFCGEFISSSQKSIIYKPANCVSSFDCQVESVNEDNVTKSNRVVYTVLFNG